MKAKHPHENRYHIDKNEYTPQLRFKMEDLEEVIKKIRTTKAAGQDGWKPVYWKIIMDSIKAERVMGKILKLINQMMDGKFNGIITKQFASTRGIPISKNKTKDKVRPVAIGLSLRRIITSMITRRINPRINEIVGHINFGTIKNGIPTFTYLMQMMIGIKYPENFKPSIIEFDIHNAFNEVHRNAMRKTCKKHFPEILKFFDSIYGEHSTIYYQEDFQLTSSRGFQQGDGLATMFLLVTV